MEVEILQMFSNGDILIMSRLIDAELIEKEEGWLDGTCLVIPKQIIYDAPTVDAKPVRHGHWNYKYPIDGKPYRYCSECLEIVYDDTVAKNYCPACGTKMD